MVTTPMYVPWQVNHEWTSVIVIYEIQVSLLQNAQRGPAQLRGQLWAKQWKMSKRTSRTYECGEANLHRFGQPFKIKSFVWKNVWLKPNQLWTILEFDEAVKQWSASVRLFAPIFQNAVLVDLHHYDWTSMNWCMFAKFAIKGEFVNKITCMHACILN